MDSEPAGSVGHYRWVAPEPLGPLSLGARPTFSVVICAYQSERFIRGAVESALAQTYPAHEVIVSDDGSTDDLLGALEPFRDRITLIRKDNGGIGSAKNFGARHATGDFLVWLDHDDAWMPDRLEALAELSAARPDLDILTTDALLERDGDVVGTWYRGPFPVEDQRRAILSGNFVYASAAVRRHRFLEMGGSDEGLRIEDWDCWIRMILDGARVGCVLEPLAIYRVRPDSVSADDERRRRNDLVVLEKALRNPALTDDERTELSARVDARRRTVELFDLKDELLARVPGLRRRLWTVACSSDYRWQNRVRAAAALVAPGLAQRRLLGREARRHTEATRGAL